MYAYKGAVVIRDVKIECMNYAGTYVGKHTATAVYTGRDVPLSMSDVHLHTIAQSSAYGVQGGGWTEIEGGNIQVENDADKGQYFSSGQKAHKRIIDGNLYIISGDKVFTPLGRRIKRL